MMMSFILFSNGYVILPSAFHAEKRYRVFYSLKIGIYKMYKITGATRKKKRGKGVRPAAIVIFETETGSCDHVFRLLCFCYGSNSVVGSFTYIIRRAANQKPIVNACSSCLSETYASAF